MKAHLSTIAARALRAAMRINHCRYRIVAIGIDSRNRYIGIATNIPRMQSRSWHAEERLIHRAPRSLRTIILARFGARGEPLPIDPCSKCAKLAEKRGIEIRRLA